MKAFVALALLVAAASAKPRFGCPSENIVHNIPDDDNCAIFYKCDHGVTVKFICPAGLLYNLDYEVCDWPENIKPPGCGGSGGGPSSSIAAPSWSTAAPSSSTAAPSTSAPTASTNPTSAPSSSSTPGAGGSGTTPIKK